MQLLLQPTTPPLFSLALASAPLPALLLLVRAVMVCDCGGCKCSRGALYLAVVEVVEVRESAARLLLRSRFTSMTKRANFVTTCLNKFNLMSWTEKLPAKFHIFRDELAGERQR